MDAMHAAIKAKRKGQTPGLLNESYEEAPAEESQESSGMAAMVAKLSPEQKEELKTLLAQESGEGSSSVAVEKGEPSSNEKAKIDQKMAEGEEGAPSEETDDIMLDGARPQPGRKATNLGQRAMQYAQERKKSKGKV